MMLKTLLWPFSAPMGEFGSKRTSHAVVPLVASTLAVLLWQISLSFVPIATGLANHGQTVYFFRHEGLDDLLVTNGDTQESPDLRHHGDCLMACLATASCVAFTHVPVQDSRCYLHASWTLVPRNHTQRLVGARYYYTAPHSSCKRYLEAGNVMSGEYPVHLQDGGSPIHVYCNFTNQSLPLTVIQRRFDGSVSFDRNWQEYARGFGNISAEFWLGNENIHRLTMAGESILRYDLSLATEASYIEYGDVTVGDSMSNYRVRVPRILFDAGAHDSMRYMRNSQFSAKDRGPRTESARGAGAFWLGNYQGIYARINHPTFNRMLWRLWKGWHTNLKTTCVSLRPPP